MKSTVLVVGGCGNIGSYIVDELLELDFKVVVIDNFYNSDKIYMRSSVDYYNIDIANMDELNVIFKKYNYSFDYIFNTASMLIKDSELFPQKAVRTNIIGLQNLILLAEKVGTLSKFVHSSSASVFGEPKYLPVDEEHPYQYKNFTYGWTKITNEMMLMSSKLKD